MEIKQFILNIIKRQEINDSVNLLLKKLNIPNLNNEATFIFSAAKSKPLFFDNEDFYRLLSFDEIINANDEFGLSLTSLNLLPLIDCGENDFICYNYKTNNWCKFNVTDEVRFSEKASILEYFN